MSELCPEIIVDDDDDEMRHPCLGGVKRDRRGKKELARS